MSSSLRQIIPPSFSRSRPPAILRPLLLLLLLCYRPEVDATPSSASTGSCPKACFCNALSKIVYCSRRGMTSIPDGISADTLQLNLNGNAFQLDTVSRANFSRYVALEHLYLSECSIETLAVDTFADLGNLRWLDLSNNRIRILVQHTFRGLALDHLFLNGNRNIQLLPGSFDGLVTAGLYLQDCSLKTLRPDVLEALNDTLRNLWLNGNELERLDRSFAAMFQRFQHLHLGSNPLHCGCEAVWLKEFYDKNGDVFKTSSQPSCFAPARLRGKYFNELSLFDFRCQSPVFSNIDIMFNDTAGRLRCSATGDPTPTLFWIQPTGKTTKYPPPTPQPPTPGQDESPSSSVVGRRNEAVLSLRPVHPSADPAVAGMTGMYICVANNEAGNVTLAVNVSWPTTGRSPPSALSNHLLPPASMSSPSPSSVLLFSDDLEQQQQQQGRKNNTSGHVAAASEDDVMAPPSVASVHFPGGIEGGGGSRDVDSPYEGHQSSLPPAPYHLSPPPPRSAPGVIAIQRMFSITELMCAIVVTHLCTLMASLVFIGVFYYRRRSKLSHQQHLIPTGGGGGGDAGGYRRSSFHGLPVHHKLPPPNPPPSTPSSFYTSPSPADHHRGPNHTATGPQNSLGHRAIHCGPTRLSD